MQSPDFARPKTSYRKLYVFQKAEAIYDLTYIFLQKHIRISDRTYDQMLQAARSGKQNIVEGRADAASSTETEIKLFGVARGSFHELLNDYEDYMRTREITFWETGHPRRARIQEFCRRNNDTHIFKELVPRLDDEEFCNLMLTLINQTIRMLDRMLEHIKVDFKQKGGIKEQMFYARRACRREAEKGRK